MGKYNLFQDTILIQYSKGELFRASDTVLIDGGRDLVYASYEVALDCLLLHTKEYKDEKELINSIFILRLNGEKVRELNGVTVKVGDEISFNHNHYTVMEAINRTMGSCDSQLTLKKDYKNNN